MTPSPYSHATYRISLIGSVWMVFCDDHFKAGFSTRSLAELLVLKMVEARCAEEKASQVLIEDGLVSEKHLCRCFEGPSPGTSLS